MGVCGDEDQVGVDAEAVERLFEEIGRAGTRALHPIEREILEGLRARPVRAWCRYQYLMLVGLHAKVFTGRVGRQ